MGVSGAAYSLGLSALWILPGCVGGFLLNWFAVARPLRRRSHEGGALTLTDILAGSAQGRKRQAIARLCALIILVCLGTYVASQFQGAGKAFSETFGWSVPVSILPVAPLPFVDSSFADSQIGGYLGYGLALIQTTDDQGSTMRASSGMVMNVHPLSPLGADGLIPIQHSRRNSDGQPLLLNNLLRVHT